MKGFLHALTKHLLDNPESLYKTTVILPNRRSGLFLRSYLSQASNKPLWLPRITTMQDWVVDHSDYRLEERLPLLFSLYESYVEITKSKEEFESFHKWGGQLLADYNNIDLYLVDPKDLFINLQSVKNLEKWELDEWSFSRSKLGKLQLNYHSLWDAMPKVYALFRSRLEESQSAYPGMAFKKVALGIHTLEIEEENIIFAGLNALSRSEIAIIRGLTKRGIAETFWDMDRTFIEDPNHEAGMFFREYTRSWLQNAARHVTDNFKGKPKNINFIGVAGNLTQTIAAGSLLDQMEKPGDLSTALVLADESLLLPMLQQIPEKVSHTNVTMGLPLAASPLPSLINAILEVQINHSGSDVYYKPIIKLMDHTLIRSVHRDNNHQLDQLKQEIIQHNRIRISAVELGNNLESQGQYWTTVLKKWNQKSNEWCENLRSIGMELSESIPEDHPHSEFNQECLKHFIKILNGLETQLEGTSHVQSLKLFRNLINDSFRKDKLDFLGEPLEGLQLMGLLETRGIDFERVIVLSANEQVLPKQVHEQSLIPYDLKLHFGLPNKHEKEAIFAYHFYRLLSRCKEAYILYNTRQEDFNQGEKSRYLTQMELELEEDHPNVQLHKSIMHSKVDVQNEEETVIEKNEFVQGRLKDLANRGISPSALQTYINSPIDFFYKYVVGLYEADEIEEEVGHAGFGDVIHDVLEELYKPYVGKRVQLTDVENMIQQYPEVLSRAWNSKYPFANPEKGKHLLAHEAMQTQIENFLSFEQSILSSSSSNLIIHSLEEEFSITVDGLAEQSIRLKGKLDRVDVLNGQLRVIDYKTGKTESKDLKIDPDKLEDVFSSPEKGKALQLSVYAYLYAAQKSHVPSVGIISLRNIDQGFLPLKSGKSEDISPIIDDIGQQLRSLIQEIMNPSIPFRSNPDVKYETIID